MNHVYKELDDNRVGFNFDFICLYSEQFMYEIHDFRLNKLMRSRGLADCSGTQFWPLYRSRAETGNDSQSIHPLLNPEPNKPSTLHQLVCCRQRSGANLRTRHWSGVDTGTESGRRVCRRRKDIFYMKKEERKKMMTL